MQSLSNYSWYSSQNQSKTFHNLYGHTKEPRYPKQSWERIMELAESTCLTTLKIYSHHEKYGTGTKQKYRLTEQHRKPRDRLTYLSATYLWQKRQEYTTERRQCLQQVVLEKLDQFSSVHSLSRVWLFATPWTTACQASLSITNSWSVLKLMSIKSVMPSRHLNLCRPLLLLPPIPPSIGSFPMSQLFAWGGQSIGVSASASVLPMNTQDWSPLGWTGWISKN